MNRDTELSRDHLSRIDAVLTAAEMQCENFRYIITGANSAVYKMTCSETGQSLIAKVGIQPHFVHLDLEFRMLKLLPEIAPNPILFGTDKSTGLQVLIESYVKGIHPFDITPYSLESMAKMIARYHQVNPPEGLLFREDWRVFSQTRIQDVADVENPLVPRFLEARNGVLKVAEQPSLNLNFNDFEGKYDQSGEVHRNVRSAVIVHGDLIPNNMIVNETGKLFIIDWEGARLDDAEADLATFIKAFRLRGEPLQEFLHAYACGNNPIEPQRLWMRTLLHYLQVIAWRLKSQIPGLSGQSEAEAFAQGEAEKEMIFVEEHLAGDKRHL